MKIALLITGQMRTFWFAIDSIIENIIKPNEPDVFIFTGRNNLGDSYCLDEMETISSYHGRNKISSLKFINEKQFAQDKIGGYLKGFNKNDYVKSYWDEYNLIYDEAQYYSEDIINDPKINKENPRPMDFVILQYLIVKKGIGMIIDYENKNGFKYDYILRIRTDMVYQNPLIIKDIVANNDSDLFFLNNYYGDAISDVFYLGKNAPMKELLLNFVHSYGKMRFPKKIIDERGQGNIFILEVQLKLFIENMNIKKSYIEGGYTYKGFEVDTEFTRKENIKYFETFVMYLSDKIYPLIDPVLQNDN